MQIFNRAGEFIQDIDEADDLDYANLSGANLTGANLQDSSMYHVNLSHANLVGVNLRSAFLFEADLSYANLTGADLTNADLDRADLSYANLTGTLLTSADLTKTNLTGANLSQANLTDIKADLYAVISVVPGEVPGLLEKIHAGQINGSVYTGECACLVGTIANQLRTDYRRIPGIFADGSRPIECFFMAIKSGDTPETNQVAAIVAEWITEWLAAQSVPVPEAA